MKKCGHKRLFVLIILVSVALVTSCRSAPVELPTSPPCPLGEEPQVGSVTDLSYLIDMNPAEVDNSDLPITAVEGLHTTVPESVEVDIEQYTLTLDGKIRNPMSLTYEEILEYPTVTKVVLLICPGFFADNAEWTGVPVATLLAEADVEPEASVVAFHGLDEGDVKYIQSFSLEEVQEDGIFLAYMVNGQVLPPEHGYPLRLVVEGGYGYKWVKWVERIEIQ